MVHSLGIYYELNTGEEGRRQPRPYYGKVRLLGKIVISCNKLFSRCFEDPVPLA